MSRCCTFFWALTGENRCDEVKASLRIFQHIFTAILHRSYSLIGDQNVLSKQEAERASIISTCWNLFFVLSFHFTCSFFFGAYANFRKATISLVMSVRLSVRLEQLGSQWVDFREI